MRRIKSSKIFRTALLFAVIAALLSATLMPALAYKLDHSGPIINEFEALPGDVDGDLIISKVVRHPFGEDYRVPSELEFEFLVELGPDYAGKTLSTTDGAMVADENGSLKIKLKANRQIGIEDLNIHTIATVTEVARNGFTVVGGASKTGVVSIGAEPIKFEFINVYSPSALGYANLTLKGEKNLEGREWSEGDSFEFLFEYEDAEGKRTELGRKTVTYDPTNADFNKFDFTDELRAFSFTGAGDYKFRISEVIGELDGILYDSTVNTFTVKIGDTDMDGRLELGGIEVDQNVKFEENEARNGYDITVEFNNKYATYVPGSPNAARVEINVDKILTSAPSFIGLDEFEFMLRATDGSFEKRLFADEEGRAVFELIFGVTDIGKTFSYELSEIEGDVAGVLYSRRVYKFDLTVTVVGGNLAVLVSGDVEINDDQEIVCEFENVYSGKGDSCEEFDWWWIILLLLTVAAISGAITYYLYYVKNQAKQATPDDESGPTE